MAPLPRSHALLLALVALGQLAAGDDSRREHKVHNIVLYPDLHSWCQTIPIKQIVAAAGHASATIDNNVCVGACYSYSIPRTQPAEPGELIGPYCDSCQPKEATCYHVTLAAAGGGGRSVQKRVQIITRCACATCGAQLEQQSACDADDGSTSELPASMRTADGAKTTGEPPDVPELLAVGSHAPATPTDGAAEAAPARPTYAVSEGVRQLLAAIANEDDEEVGEVEEEEEEDGDSEQRLAALARHERMRELRAAVVQGALARRVTDADVMQFANYVNDHYDDLDVDALRLKRVLQLYEHAHHVVGEEQRLLADGGVGRLVVGPHGSLVVAPAEAKLSIDSHDVAPNHEGVVIDYQHPHPHHHGNQSYGEKAGAGDDAV